MKITRAMFDPIPIDAESEEPIKLTAARAELAPFAKLANASAVSTSDRVLIKRCLDNIEHNRIVSDPFAGVDGYEDENFRNLRIMAGKYARTSASADSALHKTAGGDYVDELIKAAVDGLRAGQNIILPAECRIPFMRVPSLKTLVASGRICFDYAG